MISGGDGDGPWWEYEDTNCAYYGDVDCPSTFSYMAHFTWHIWRWIFSTFVTIIFSLWGVPWSSALLSPRLLQVLLSLSVASLLLLLLSLVFWRYRVLRYNRSLGLRMPLHQWEAFSSASFPRYCCVCRELISGFLIYRNSGWKCCLCQRSCHANCLTSCDILPCKTPAARLPLKHQLVEGNLPADSTCCCCGVACSSTFGLDGFRCLWCGRTVHSDCETKLSPHCDLGPLRLLVLPPTAVAPLLSAATSHQILLRLATSLKGRGMRMGEVVREMGEVVREVRNGVTQGVRRFNQSLLKTLRSGLRHERRNTMALVDVDDTEPHNVIKGTGVERSQSNEERQLLGVPYNMNQRLHCFRSTAEHLISVENSSVEHEQELGHKRENKMRGICRMIGRRLTDDGNHATASSVCLNPMRDGTFPSVCLRKLRYNHKLAKKGASQVLKHSGTKQMYMEDLPLCLSSISQSQRCLLGSSCSSPGGSCTSETSERSSSREVISRVEALGRQVLSSEVCDETITKKQEICNVSKKERSVSLRYSIAKYLPAKNSLWRLRSATSLWFIDPDTTPLLVFVNVKSGGQAGRAIYKELAYLLNPIQVIDIQAEGGPQRALDFFRPLVVARKLRVLVCGGDGTVGWVIDSIQKIYASLEAVGKVDVDPITTHLPRTIANEEIVKPVIESEKIENQLNADSTCNSEFKTLGSTDNSINCRAARIPPTFNSTSTFLPVGICPLGTGNDLSNVLGWGLSFDGDIRQQLRKIERAIISTLDIWNVRVLKFESSISFETTFSNYLDVGVAARILMRFHKLREENPELFQSRLGNKFLYGEVGVRDFLASRASGLEGIRLICDDKEVQLPNHTVEGVCVVNIPSFAGGVRLWEDSNTDGVHHSAFITKIGIHHDLHGKRKVVGIPSAKYCSARRLSNIRFFPLLRCRTSRSPHWHQKFYFAKGKQHLHFVAGRTLVPWVGKKRVRSRGMRIDGCHSKKALRVNCVSRRPETQYSKSDQCNARLPFDCWPSDFCEPKHYCKGFPTHHCTSVPEVLPRHSPFDQNSDTCAPFHCSQKHDVHKLRSGTNAQWKQQSINDGLLEVVAFKSLFHLGQVQVGLAKPVRLCQGSNIKVILKEQAPLQIDGEPRLLEKGSVIEISPKCQTLVLMASEKSPHMQTLAAVQQVLDSAYQRGNLNETQCALLYREFQRRL